jgi:hypothetical protein
MGMCKRGSRGLQPSAALLAVALVCLWSAVVTTGAAQASSFTLPRLSGYWAAHTAADSVQRL